MRRRKADQRKRDSDYIIKDKKKRKGKNQDDADKDEEVHDGKEEYDEDDEEDEMRWNDNLDTLFKDEINALF